MEPNSLIYNPIYQISGPDKNAERQTAQHHQILEARDKQLEWEDEHGPTGWDVTKSAFRQENSAVAYLNSPLTSRDPVEGYNVFNDLDGYEDVPEAFVGIHDPATATERKGQIDQQRADAQILAQGDWRASLAMVGAGMTSPGNLALMVSTWGVGAGPLAGNVLRSAVRNMAVGAVGVGMDELALSGIQSERTLEHSAITLLSTAVLDGLVGGAIGKLSRNTYDGAVNQMARQIQYGAPTEATVEEFAARSGGAALTDRGISTAPMKAAGALYKYTGIEALAHGLARITPNFRMMKSESPATRETAQAISELHMRSEGEIGTTSAETLIKADTSRTAVHVMAMEDAIKSSGLSREDFGEQWASAMRYGPESQDFAPGVVEYAQRSRELVYDNLWKRATEAGVGGTYSEKKVLDLTDEERALTREDGTPWVEEWREPDELVRIPVSQNTAPDYLQRWYDIEKLSRDPQGFMRAIREGIEDQEARTTAALDVQMDEILGEGRSALLGNKKIIDTYERSRDANKIVYSEARRSFPAAEADVKAQQRIGVGQTKQIEVSELGNLSQKKTELLEDIGTLEQSITNIKRSIDTRVRSTQSPETRGMLRQMRKTQVQEASAQIKVNRMELQKLTVAKNKIKSDAIEARQFVKAESDQMIRTLRRELASLKNTRNTVPLAEYRKARKDLSDIEGQLREIDSQRPRQRDDTEWTDLTQNYMDTVSGFRLGDLHGGPSTTSGPNALKHRVDIQDRFLDEFLVKDPEQMMKQVTASLSPKIRMSEAFGDTDGDYMLEGALQRINEGYTARMAAASKSGNVKLHDGLKKAREADIKDTVAVRDRLLNLVASSSIAGSHPALIAGLRTMRNLQTAQKLGRVLAASIPDIARQLSYGAMGKYTRATIKAAKHWGLDKLPKEDSAKLASALIRSQNSRIQQLMEYDDLIPTGRIEAASRYAAQKLIKLSGLQHLDSINKTISGFMVADKIAANLLQGTSAKGMRNLSHLGIHGDVAEDITYFLRRYAAEEDGLINPRLDMWNPDGALDPLRARRARESYEGAVIKEADRLTMTPGAGDKPILMNSEVAKTLFQFKSFLIGAMNRITIPLMQEEGMRPIVEMIMSTSIGALAIYARAASIGQDVDEDTLLLDAMDRGAYTATALELYHMGAKTAGLQTSTRFQSRSDVGALLGPSGGSAQDLLKLLNAGGSSVDTQVHAFRRLMPFQNLIWLDRLITKAEGAAAKALGGSGRYAKPKQRNRPAEDLQEQVSFSSGAVPRM